MNVRVDIERLVEPIAALHGTGLVEIVLRGKRNSQVLEIFVDEDSGVTTEKCAEISRDVSKALDESKILGGSYTLVVSSPGLDRPLKTPAQFRRSIGRRLRIRLAQDDTTREIEGLLKGYDGEFLEVESPGDLREVFPMTSVLRAKIVLPW
jgi:ribosome maturation factor RimP